MKLFYKELIKYGGKIYLAKDSHLEERDFNKAADEMIDSAWYRQVPNRAGRLVKRMRALA